jgi:hypothetical protein
LTGAAAFLINETVSYLIHPENPLKLSWALFIREPYIIKERFVHPGLPGFQARWVHPVGEGRSWEQFKIHLGRYSLDAKKNAKKIANYGLPVAATLDGELVGAVNSFNLWVHPSFTKQRLAIEMIVDRFRYTGAGAGPHYTETSTEPMRYTPEGLAALKAGYREIVKRGLIDPGPAGVP